ncbi:RHS repeat-associated protein [Pseudomonas sp. BS3782 TE3695]|uniref:RHS repeat-associated core domain-containing protein n=1 Tax=Pseudomonas sp. BS3782 TE3695 TaxID=3349323 RepID=UPI003D1CD27C
MSTPSLAVLCQYKYDPLDRLIASSPAVEQRTQRFYNKNRLTTELQGSIHNCLFQIEDQLLAQSRHANGVITNTLLVNDFQRSVLQTVSANTNQPASYTAYGHTSKKCDPPTLLGFNGERIDPITGHYLLGNGYRAFNPVLMRFNSPDSWSPFGKGGINSYAYCECDPVNFSDPTGHFLSPFRRFLVSTFGNLPSKPQLSVSLDFTGGAVEGISRYQNIKRVSGGIYAADEPLLAGG